MMSNVQLQQINEDVRSFVEEANQGQRGLRVVPLGVAFEIARRSFLITGGETFSVRRFRALSDVSDFVSLAQKNKVTTLSANNADLLPVAHPASTQKHRMSQVGILRAQARWFADDARISDSNVSSLLATLFTESSDTPEYAYASARLSAMTAGGITLSALVAVAIGFNDGANRGYWRQQIRDRGGQWAKMFGLGGFKIKKADGKVYRQYGQVVSTDVNNKKARLLTRDNRIVEASTDALSREAKAILPSAETPDGVSAAPVRSSSEDIIIPEAELTLFPSPAGFDSVDSSSANFPNGLDAANVDEVWQDDLGNFQAVKGNFRDGEGSEFVVSRLEGGRVVPIGAGKDWADVQRIITKDEPDFKDGKDAVPDLPEGLNISPSTSGVERADAPDEVAELPEGGYRVDRGPYEPRGAAEGVESENYTDDPADLAVQFTPEELGDALKDGVDDGTGVGRLEFGDDKGTEDVPAEALYNALKAQGVDADRFLDDVEAGKDVKASLPRGADIPELDAPRDKQYKDAKSTRELLGDSLPALLQGLSDRELQALIEQDFDFRSLVDANRDRDVPEGFYPLSDGDYSPLAPIPGAPNGLTPFQLSLEFSPEQLENQLREAITPAAERSGYGKFDVPDSNDESRSFDVPAEAITDALKLHAVNTDELLDEIYGGGTPTDEEIGAMIREESVAEDVFGGLTPEMKEELIAATKEGGYTVDIVTGDVPTDGYMVASEADVFDERGELKKREEVISREDFDADSGKYVDDFISRNIDKLLLDGYYVGTWTSKVRDEETGEEREYVFFDVSERIESKEEALQAARDRNEIAVFGMAELEEFFTDPEREEQKNAGEQTQEGDDTGSEELPGDDRGATPGVGESGDPGDSGEPGQQEEVVSRPFGEEIQELDVSGDLEAQIKDALENQRELVFAYQGSGDAPTDRLVRPIRLETNERTSNVNLLAVDDEGNFKKFTLSKMENASDVQGTQDDVIGEETAGDEIETDDAALPDVDAYNAARGKVLQEVSRAEGDVDTNDVEDLGERGDVDDNITTQIVEAVDGRAEEGDEEPVSDDEIAKAVAELIREVVDADDAQVPSLEELLERVGDKDNYDPDIIWQDVIDNFGGKVLPNGHIVVSSVMHGDRRYDVTVRRDEGNNFHVYHRVIYPDKTTKVREMGGIGWQSTKALFDKIQKQISNSIFRPKTTVNKNLKPENDKTLRAAIILPQVGDAYVTANGSTVSKGDFVVVVRENHKKFGQRAKILYTANRFTAKDYTYTDYLRVQYDDGEKNWIRSQSVDPADAPETTETESAQGLEQATAELNERQAGGVPEDLFSAAATPDADGFETAAAALTRVADLMPVPPTYSGDDNLPDRDIQPLAKEFSELAESLGSAAEAYRKILNDGTPLNRATPELLNSLRMQSQYVSMLGVQLRQKAKDSSSERAGFYSDLAEQIVLFGDNWFEEARDATLNYMDESSRKLSERLPEGSIPSSENITLADVEDVISRLAEKLPAPDELANYYEDGNDGPLEAFLGAAAADLDKVLTSIRLPDPPDLDSLNLSPLNRARGTLASQPEAQAVAEDLEELLNSIRGARSEAPITEISLPGGETADPLEIQESRIANGDNEVSLNTAAQKVLSDAAASGNTPLSDFEDEVNNFFSGGGGPLAQLSPRARVALQKTISEKLRTDYVNLLDSESEGLLGLIAALDVEERAYYPDRGGVGEEADILRQIDMDNLFDNTFGFRLNDGDQIVDDNGDFTGWVVERSEGGGINETVQLRNEDTGQLLWLKREMYAATARAEYVASRLSRALGVPGAPIVDLLDASDPDSPFLLITQAGENVGVSSVEKYSDVFNEVTGSVEALGKLALMDVIRLGILDPIIFNGDRHGGNFLVGNIGQYGVSGDEYSLRLIPIDHGLATNLVLSGGASLSSGQYGELERYIQEIGATGGNVVRNLLVMMGAENFRSLSVSTARDFLANVKNMRNNREITLGNSDIIDSIDRVIADLEIYLDLPFDVFEQIEARGPEMRP